MLEYINKRMEELNALMLEARAIINDTESSPQAFRQAQNTIIEMSARVSELYQTSQELLSRNRAQKDL